MPTQPTLESAQAVAEEVLTERFRQQVAGYTTAHDDGHSHKELAEAAIAYIRADATGGPWPIHPKGYRANLVKAAALLIAEIERHDRQEASSAQEPRSAAVGLSGVQAEGGAPKEGQEGAVQETVVFNAVDDGLTLEVSYNRPLHRFLVRVTDGTGESLSQEVPANFVPAFGMDVTDEQACMSIAELLVRRLEEAAGVSESSVE